MTDKLLAPLEWSTEKRKVSDLIPYDYNPRKISDIDKDRLKKSLEKFNLVEIPVVDIDNVLIAGHQRVFILFELKRGNEFIDVRVPNRKLTEGEFKEYNLRSNISNGEFDFEKIEAFFNDIDLEDIGFDMISFEDFVESNNLSLTEIEGDIDTDLPENPVAKLGDVYEFNSLQKGITHRVVCGDSTNEKTYKSLLGDEIFDLIVTDPPYNVNYEGGTKKKLKIKNDHMSGDKFFQFLYDFFKNSFERTVAGGPAYIFYSDSEAVNFRKAMVKAGYKISSTLIWVKNQFVLGRLDYHMKHEPLLVGEFDNDEIVKQHQAVLYGWQSKGKHPWYSDRKQSSVLEFDKPKRNADHPTMKPLKLIEYLIQNSSKQKNIVGDMFLGSGTTLIASEKTWRTCRGVEFDPCYMDVIVRRYINYMESNHLKFKITQNNQELSKEDLDKFRNS
ncbi:DNA modification methylase [Tenacibaculum maritimum]|uniref:DNA modification methylase n=1 Tax=Tenacibaculum maritimum TaxID=107401 RepID=UPI0012E4D9BC|nr:DNA modification methylase [Tenacibaculum maritimum]CAA0157127.1 Methyltransferase [Tenacibaculum maritimum]CAA0170263.1 Methyltransferase [Tenacibaculum maritimum]CAA0239370.1 Methyltransferase [Tenacibaculum maritimum]